MKNLVLILFLSISQLAFAQNTWFKFIPGWQAQKSILLNDTFFTFGTGDFSPSDNFLAVNKVSINGDLLKSDSFIYRNIYKDSTGITFYYWNTINPIVRNNNLFIPTNITFYTKNKTFNESKIFKYPNWEKFILDISQDTNVSELTFVKSFNNLNYGIIRELLVLSKQRSDFYYQLICFTDSNYKVIKKQIKGISFMDGHFPQYDYVHADNQNKANLFLQILDQWNFAGIPAEFEGVIQKIDTTGKLIWECKPAGNQDSINTTDFKMVQLPNGNLLCSWFDLYYRPYKNKDYLYYRESINEKATLWYAEIDYLTGKVKWQRNYRQFLDWKMRLTNKDFAFTLTSDLILINNGIVRCGFRYKNKPNPQSYTAVPYLFKTDFNGNPIWYREYDLFAIDLTDKGFTPYSFIQTPDNGFLLTGEYNRRWRLPDDTTNTDYFFQSAALLKVDSNGCFTSDCNATDRVIRIQAPTQICSVFPNPANSYISLTYPKGTSNWQATLIDLNGKVVQTFEKDVQTINTFALPNGIYILQLSHNNNTYNETHKITIQH